MTAGTIILKFAAIGWWCSTVHISRTISCVKLLTYQVNPVADIYSPQRADLWHQRPFLVLRIAGRTISVFDARKIFFRLPLPLGLSQRSDN